MVRFARLSGCQVQNGEYLTAETGERSCLHACRSNGSEIEIVQDVELNDFSREKFAASVQELAEEREAVKDLI